MFNDFSINLTEINLTFYESTHNLFPSDLLSKQLCPTEYEYEFTLCAIIYFRFE